MSCPSTMTLGGGGGEWERIAAKMLGTEDTEWPVHRCELTWPHEMPHREGDITWDGIVIRYPIRVPHD